MKNQNPLLSISLLSSGRDDTLWKCLESLKPIQNALATELIIVDTGCDAEMRARMESYADRIVSFEWCDDFSKARNTGLSLCNGEWFLYLDDDEWFEDLTELISFFTSGEYQNYNLAYYFQRNYLDRDGTQYSDQRVSRIIKVTKEVRFELPIHEHLCPWKGKAKTLSTYVHHYGYVFHSLQDWKAHSKRNIKMLERALDNDPKNSRLWKHLAQEYINEPHKLRDLCFEAVEKFKDIDNRIINIDRSVFYAGILKAESINLDYTKVEELAEKFMKDMRNGTFCNLMLNFFLVKACFENKKYEKAIETCEKYFSLYEEVCADETIRYDESVFFVADTLQESQKDRIYCIYISSKLYLHDTSALKAYFNMLGWNRFLSLEKSFNEDVIYAMAHMDYEEIFSDVAEVLLNHEKTQLEIHKLLREYESQEEEYNRLLRVFSTVDSNYYYIDYMKLLFANQTNNQTMLEKSACALISKLDNFLQIDDKIYDIIEQKNVDLNSIMKKLSFERWKNGVNQFCESSSKEKLNSRMAMLKRMDIDPVRLQYFEVKATELAIVHLVDNSSDNTGSKKVEYNTLRKAFVEFVDTTLPFYQTIYQAHCFEGEMEFLPPICRAAVKIKTALESESSTGMTESGKAWLDCVDIYKPFNNAIIIYAKMHTVYQKELKKRKENQEMLVLAENIKASIQTLMEQGLWGQAAEVLKQLKAYVPDDEEILLLEDVLNGYLEQ